MNRGSNLWKKAKKIIPGGNMLFSKREEQFLPGSWPNYFNKASGCEVWDLDDNKYRDLSYMGVGTNILGYGNPEVDDAVRRVVDTGNMSTLNCEEEVRLAERLVEILPWFDMVKFTRSGGEANSVAIRIARAASGRDQVAVCGYHGWHDWYLAANLEDPSNLNKHLLPGLPTEGVSKLLEGSVFTFNFNDYNALEDIVKYNKIGVIKMEVMRNVEPEEKFLEKVRLLADKNGIVLIFDECTSGFRETFGGLHQKYAVTPDMAIFGKALGNGYAINAVIGKSDIMRAADRSFISSTFWTERIGPTAALKTLEVMESLESWKVITAKGHLVRKTWKRLAEKWNLNIQVMGLPALSTFLFSSEHHIQYKTFLTQEMLKRGMLATNAFYASICHTEDILEEYFSNLDEVFRVVSECEAGRDINSLLEGPVCQSGFKRLN